MRGVCFSTYDKRREQAPALQLSGNLTVVGDGSPVPPYDNCPDAVYLSMRSDTVGEGLRALPNVRQVCGVCFSTRDKRREQAPALQRSGNLTVVGDGSRIARILLHKKVLLNLNSTFFRFYSGSIWLKIFMKFGVAEKA